MLVKIKGTPDSLAEVKYRAVFMLVQDDPIVLYKIKRCFGFGRVQKHGSDYYRWCVTKKDHVRLLC